MRWMWQYADRRKCVLCIMVLTALSLAIAYYGSSRCTECAQYFHLSTQHSVFNHYWEGVKTPPVLEDQEDQPLEIPGEITGYILQPSNPSALQALILGERNDVNCTVDLCRINFAPVPWKANPVARCNGDMRACVTFFCKTFCRLLATCQCQTVKF